ncbi:MULTISPECIES: FadR/GntR family transcriptional regulator [unclassified Pseudomonas]|uniref:FadR/GntR family transcriptional regulator n=1 Tax=unclassified Pseudomonas TaxID=196821 RepID=UPI000BD7B119|nr:MULTISPECIES: FadR/GntR family transcriptional regulator [unclassified Pseudomonas]PVZ11258.1 DNA-binding FadR family transcriptional regulator [Pseudomonas sp. URIL14HWK12:I12]PVZ22256.1 DNA-binding FadR family transcriptional regulator [Pseudomonas sp. URIL14HWK12:I10]PVZ31620.1 DNA-binding FadR family transcriptional regulator [Pseudomonas sp. URIL14HWK12:I11]SNZ16646.1 transcriptional regulator, GntR family [Pseudomonas sp. URIL14HWK12:I9]
MPEPLLKRSLVDQALERLRERIAQGHWAVGERLPTEPELALELGISRNTVREAMRVLAFSGLIEIRQGDGSYLRGRADPSEALKAMSGCTLDQARETRRIIEVEAIMLACTRRTADDLAALRAALANSGEHYHRDLERYIACDMVFHQRLVDAAHNPMLSQLYRYFSQVVAGSLRLTLHPRQREQSIFDLHAGMVDAVEARDGAKAARLCRELIDSGTDH